MANRVKQIELSKLTEHPDNANRMSREKFAKLLRNIERSGRYEPLIVRPDPQRQDYYQIINGHHRARALQQIGRKKADVLIWDVDDEQTHILLATLNRLSGSDLVSKKIALLKKLKKQMDSKALGMLLPQGPAQIEKLTSLKPPETLRRDFEPLAEPLMFFVTTEQKHEIEKAISLSQASLSATNRTSRARRRSRALAVMAHEYIESLAE